jgi:hypothetical protein
MSLIAKDTSTGEFAPISEGLHHAVCFGVVDLGTQPGGQFPARRKVSIIFEVPGERAGDSPRTITSTFTLSLNSKGALRPMLESWRGRAFTPKELEGFDLKNVVGANAFINVVHATGTGPNAGKTYANIKSVNPLPKGTGKLTSELAHVWFSIDECVGGIVVPDAVPEWLKKRILGSAEATAPKVSESAHPTEAEMANQSEPADENVPF